MPSEPHPTDETPPSTSAGATPTALEILRRGEVEIQGRMPWSSNATFLVTVAWGGVELPGIYKPERGERPLWDFPGGLYRREAAAYELAVALGWDLVPETVVREDAPLGVGSIQRFVDADFEHHYFTLLEDERHHPALARMAVFDQLANNADRKGGHCLIDQEGHIWGIDHGLCFHPHPKLRTVIWDFVDEPIADDLLAAVRQFGTCGIPRALAELLTGGETEALSGRALEVLRRRRLPAPQSDRPYPWPLV